MESHRALHTASEADMSSTLANFKNEQHLGIYNKTINQTFNCAA